MAEVLILSLPSRRYSFLREATALRASRETRRAFDPHARYIPDQPGHRECGPVRPPMLSERPTCLGRVGSDVVSRTPDSQARSHCARPADKLRHHAERFAHFPIGIAFPLTRPECRARPGRRTPSG